MQNATLWRAVLGVEKTVVEDVEFDEAEQVLVAHVRPKQHVTRRCGRCRRRCRGYDQGEGRRRWRGLDLGTIPVWLEADAPRVDCPRHGVVVAAVPWARHGAGHTFVFDEQVAWLATQCSRSAVTELMRIAWRTVGAIISRVWADVEQLHDRFARLRRIGIDEISYKRGHKYLTVVVDHDSGRLVWAAPGRDKATLDSFFDALEASGEGRAPRSAMSAPMGRTGSPPWSRTAAPSGPLRRPVPYREMGHRSPGRGPPAGLEHRPRRGHPTPRRPGHRPRKGVEACPLRVVEEPGEPHREQQAKLAWIAKTDPRLHRAYLLKEGLRTIFSLDPAEAPVAFDKWIGWARRCRIDAFVELQRRIVKHKDSILAAIEHGLSNGRIESVNTKIRLITRIAFGFATPEPLIALAMLSLGGHPPTLPGRT